VVCYNENLAKIAQQFLAKGSQVYLEGQLETRKFIGKDNTERSVTEIIMKFNAQLVMLGGKGKSGSEEKYTGKEESGGGRPDFDDGIPFAPEWRG
jgi:single-strand DNA-binding protein